jgi:hypothetical protein
MDNCATHKSNAVREVIEAAGRRLVFLLPYSPDFSPIEESFSCGTILFYPALHVLLVLPFTGTYSPFF